MTAARAIARRPLWAGALLVAAGWPGESSGDPPRTLHGQRCAPAACTLARPTATEFHALVAEADRLLARYAEDDTPLGRQCHALGAAMRAHVADVRMVDHMWREIDENGDLAPVTGDAHRVEVIPGGGRVHIARGYDALNPDRGLPAIVQTARHEFAHLNGSPQRALWSIDVADRVATVCGQP